MESKFKVPTETVELPSKGLLYPEGSPLKSGTIEMKYMTAKEEDILTNTNYIKNGTVIDKLLQSLIVTDINYNDLLIGDKNAIMVAARILSYGKDYTFGFGGEEYTIDLALLEHKELSSEFAKAKENTFNLTLPHSENQITFKLLSHGDEQRIEQEIAGLKRINKDNTPEVTTRLKHIITSINGSTDKNDVRDFVEFGLLAKDARALREYYATVSPDIEMKFFYKDETGADKEAALPVGITFFWPDAGV